MKRFLAGLMSVVVLFGAIPVVAHAEGTVTCNVRIGDIDADFLPRTSITIEPTSSEVIYDIEENPSTATALDALVEGVYYSLYDADMDPNTITDEEKTAVLASLGNTTQSSGWIDGLYGTGGDSAYSWLYADGKTSPTDSITQHEVTSDSDLWFYYCNWQYGYRGYFSENSLSMNEGDSVSIKLTGVPILSEMYGTYEEKAIPGVIHVGDYTFNCDSEGNAIISGVPAGTYSITADWDNNTDGWQLLTPKASLEVIPTSTEQPTPASNVSIAYDTMRTIYSSKTLVNDSSNDITVFWDMLAKRSLNLNSQVSIDFKTMDYNSMSTQQLAKTLITMINNNFDYNTAISGTSSVIDLINSKLLDGEYSTSGNTNTTMATEQVWVMIALYIAGEDIPDSAWEYLMDQQNFDGGFGYGTWSDVATTEWVQTLVELAGESANLSDKMNLADTYVSDNFDSLFTQKDTNSLAAMVSYRVLCGVDVDSFIADVLTACYNDTGYFIWGDNTAENAYATMNGTQMLGDYTNGSVYTNLKNSYDPSSSDTPTTDDPTSTPSNATPSTSTSTTTNTTSSTTNNTTNNDTTNSTTNNSSKTTNNYNTTNNESVTNNYSQADPVVVTNTVTREITKETVKGTNGDTIVNTYPNVQVTPAVTIQIPDYRNEIRVFLALFGLIAIAYTVSVINKISGGKKHEE